MSLGDDASPDEITVQEHPLGVCPFSPEGAPIRLSITGYQVPSWGMEDGNAQEIPLQPQPTAGPGTSLELIPYGCTNLRVTEFPTFPGFAG